MRPWADSLENVTRAFDDTIRSWVVAHQVPWVATFAQWVSTIGSVSPMVWLAVVAAILLYWRAGPPIALVVLLAPVTAVATYHSVRAVYHRARPAGLGHVVESTYSFPSAHCTTSAAVCGTLAYVLWRERLVSGLAALVFATFVPTLVGASRVYLDVHWATDVLGGWSAGLLIAALSAMLYNHTRVVRP